MWRLRKILGARRAAPLAAALLGAGLLAAGAVVAWLALRQPSTVAAPPAPLADDAPAAPQAAEALVFVSGAVATPGLYRLPAGARVSDAIAAAGGITPDADPGKLPDLAARVHDGRQVNVPLRRSGGSGGGTAGTRLDLNSATADELRAVPGMPAGLPEAIVDRRQRWGPFTSLTQLRTELGIDAATLAGLRPHLRVVAPPA